MESKVELERRPVKPLIVSEARFKALPIYNDSLPPLVVGTQFRRMTPDGWHVFEYIAHPTDEKKIGIFIRPLWVKEYLEAAQREVAALEADEPADEDYDPYLDD